MSGVEVVYGKHKLNFSTWEYISSPQKGTSQIYLVA